MFDTQKLEDRKSNRQKVSVWTDSSAFLSCHVRGSKLSRTPLDQCTCFTLYLRAIFKYKPPPPGAYIRRGDLTKGFLRYEFGGAYCWFSHYVTKPQTTKLSFLLRFYFHGVLEQLKTNFQTNFRLA